MGSRSLRALEEFRNGARASTTTEKKIPPAVETVRLLQEGHSFEDIAKLRGRLLSTVVSTVAGLVESGELEFSPQWIDAEKQAQIEAACARLGVQALRPIKDALPAEITFEEIKLIVARLRWEASKPAAPKTA